MCLLTSPERLILGTHTCLYTRPVTPEKLAELSRAISNAEQDLKNAIATRNEAIVQAAVDRVPKDAVCEATGLTKEQVRRIERAGGAPKRDAGRPTGTKRATGSTQ